MNEERPADGSGRLTAQEWDQFDGACLAFEAEWRAKQQPDIAAYLPKVDERLRGRLFRELVKVDHFWRMRRECACDLAEYRRRFSLLAHFLDGLTILNDGGSTYVGPKLGSADLPTIGSNVSIATDEEPIIPAGEVVGEEIGEYRIVKKLGSGSFSIVYLAIELKSGGEVALKVSRSRLDSGALELFRREAAILKKLKHNHIVAFRKAWVNGDRYFVVCDLMSENTLKKKLQGGRLEPREAAKIAFDVAKALAYAHTDEHNLVHRDVKPANILFDSQGNAVLADFGVAHVRSEFSLEKSFSGTPTYMSPEQAAGDAKAVDGRSDIYGLGVVLYEMITGSVPYQCSTTEELLKAIRTIDPTPPRQPLPDLDPKLEEICLRCLARRPVDRYNSAADLVAALDAFLNPKVDPPPAPPRFDPTPWLSVSLAVVALVVVLLWRPWERPPPPAPVVQPTPVDHPAPVAEVKLDRAEFFVQHGEADTSEKDLLVLVFGGMDQTVKDLPPLTREDRFVLRYRFDRPAPWLLIHVDPAGGAAVVAKSTEPQQMFRVREKTGVKFSAKDPRGVNLLLLVSGTLPKDITEAALADRISQARASINEQVFLSRLRAGFDEETAAIQLPEDYITEVERKLPPDLKPQHAILVTTQKDKPEEAPEAKRSRENP